MANTYGIDGISAGLSISFAMDCYEHGLLTKEDTDSLELKFSNFEAMLQLVKKISLKEGIGSKQAEGVRKAARIIGNGAKTYANHIKGPEMTGYNLRG